MAQVASGGGWQTIFTLVNTGTSSGQARLNFFDDNGSPLALPLLFLEAANGTTTTDFQIAVSGVPPGGVLVIQTQGQDQPPVVGSAQLTIAGNFGGFAIFRYNPTGQEAVVPLETRNASAYVLAFDNTNGLATGVALANVTDQAASVPVILRDEMGSLLGTDTLALAGNGHTSFMLTQNYSATAGKRGTVEFQAPSGSEISVLGLRASGNALTTLPVFPK